LTLSPKTENPTCSGLSAPLVSEAVQGKPTDIGCYYRPDDAKASAAMRPSATLNAIIG